MSPWKPAPAPKRAVVWIRTPMAKSKASLTPQWDVWPEPVQTAGPAGTDGDGLLYYEFGKELDDLYKGPYEWAECNPPGEGTAPPADDYPPEMLSSVAARPTLRFDVPEPDPNSPGRRMEELFIRDVLPMLRDGKSVRLVSGDRHLTTLHPSWFRHDTAGTYYSASALRNRAFAVLHRSEDGLGWTGYVCIRPNIDREDAQAMPSVQIVALHTGKPTKAEACATLDRWLVEALTDAARWEKACARADEDPAVVREAAELLRAAYLQRPPVEADPPEG